MAERPILFQGAMVRALLAGTKTQTRRLAKFVPIDAGLNFAFTGLRPAQDRPGGWTLQSRDGATNLNDRTQVLRCPYGQPGDRLWVREAWGYFDPDNTGQTFEEKNDDGGNGPCKTYAPELMQDGHQLREYWRRRIAYRATWQDGAYGTGPDAPARWRPSIHMPRWASRILLDVTEVRVERLQSISDEDAQAEGCPCYVCGRPMDGLSEDDCHCFHRKASASDYQHLWDSINSKTSGTAWADNPWVWAVSFKRVVPA